MFQKVLCMLMTSAHRDGKRIDYSLHKWSKRVKMISRFIRIVFELSGSQSFLHIYYDGKFGGFLGCQCKSLLFYLPGLCHCEKRS